MRPESADVLLAYLDEVQGRTFAMLEGLGPDDLDRVVDRRWDPPVTLGVRLVSVATTACSTSDRRRTSAASSGSEPNLGRGDPMGGRRRLPRLQPRGELERQRPTPLSCWTCMQELVNRYKNSPALGIWEPISSPSTRTWSRPALRGDQCGTAGADYLAHCSYNTGPGDRLTGLFG